MEIGSEVFAQEVEPTGLLSMEMTLARYIRKLTILFTSKKVYWRHHVYVTV